MKRKLIGTIRNSLDEEENVYEICTHPKKINERGHDTDKTDDDIQSLKYESYRFNPTVKVKYCPFVLRMIQRNNNNKIKFPIVSSVIDYFDTRDVLKLRLISKRWNEVVKSKLNFLKKNVFELNPDTIKEIKQTYLTHKTNKMTSTADYLDRSPITAMKSGKKYSKKMTLIKLISSKNYHTIKSKVALGEMSKPKNLVN